jgi:hypothetical protein
MDLLVFAAYEPRSSGQHIPVYSLWEGTGSMKSKGSYRRPIEDRRNEPCQRGHSREDARVAITSDGKPYLRCRQCARENQRRQIARKRLPS